MKTIYRSGYALIEYNPTTFLGNLEWFNVAKCARERMAEAMQEGDFIMWQRHRKTFYVALSKMILHPTNFILCEG